MPIQQVMLSHSHAKKTQVQLMRQTPEHQVESNIKSTASYAKHAFAPQPIESRRRSLQGACRHGISMQRIVSVKAADQQKCTVFGLHLRAKMHAMWAGDPTDQSTHTPAACTAQHGARYAH
jgi:hypothetical protein